MRRLVPAAAHARSPGRTLPLTLRHLAPIIVLSVVAALVVSVALPTFSDRGIDESDLLIGFLTLTTVGPVLFAAWSPRGDVFSPLPLMSAVMIIEYVSRAIYLKNSSAAGETVPPNLQGDYRLYITPALELVSTAWLALLIAYLSPIAKVLVRAVPPVPWLTRRVNTSRVFVLVFVAFLFHVYLIATKQNLAFGQHESGDLSTKNFAGMGAGLALTALFIYAARSFSRTQGGMSNTILWGLLFPGLLLIGMLSGGKMALFQPLLVVAVAYHYFHTRLGIRDLAVLFAILVLVILPFMGTYRNVYARNGRSDRTLEDSLHEARDAAGEVSARNDFWGDALEGATSRFDGLDSPMIAVKMTPRYIPWSDPTLYGLFPIMAVVPRALWTSKPKMIVLPQWETEYWGDLSGGSSWARTMVGALYCAFGFWGAVLGMALHGAALRAIYLYLRQHWGILSGALYCALIPAILRLGIDIPNVWGNIIQTIIVLLIIFAVLAEQPESRTAGRLIWRGRHA